MAYLRVTLNRLRKGMMIVSDVYNDKGMILVPSGTAVTKEVIQLLTKHFIDSVMVEYIAEAQAKTRVMQEEPSADNQVKYREFQEKFHVAEDDIAKKLRTIVNGVEDIEVSMLLDTVNQVIGKSNGEAELIGMLMRMKSDSATLYQHSMNVAMFSQLLARWVQCSKEEIELVTIAGVLHDIGLINQSWNQGQTSLFQKLLDNEDKGGHAIDGFNLIKNRNIDGRVKQAVLTHHERLDGSGYPLQTLFSDINKISRIIAIADVYDILTMRENGKEGLSAFSALGKMEEMGANKLDAHLLMQFTRNIAESMIQHQVLLNTGQICNVIMIDKYNISRPLLQVENGFVDLKIRKDIYIKEILD